MKLNKCTILAIISILLAIQTSYAKGQNAKQLTPKITSPTSSAVWHEGKTYTIKWKGFKEGIVCIAVLIGGHYAGIINSCNNCALEGKFRWKIPKGFVTGFGENKNNKVRIVIYYKDNESEYKLSDFFTISQ